MYSSIEKEIKSDEMMKMITKYLFLSTRLSTELEPRLTD